MTPGGAIWPLNAIGGLLAHSGGLGRGINGGKWGVYTREASLKIGLDMVYTRYILVAVRAITGKQGGLLW
jgi:hypothetical protein